MSIEGWKNATVVAIVENDEVQFNVEDMGLKVMRVPHVLEAPETFIVPGAAVIVLIGEADEIVLVEKVEQ